MRHTYTQALLIGVLLLLTGLEPGIAQTTGEELAVHWEDIERAVDQHPAMQAAAREADAAAAEAGAVRQYPNPSIGIGLGRAEALAGDEQDRVSGLEVTLPILSPWAYRNSIAAAEAERGAIDHDVAALRLGVIEDLKAAFWRVAYDRQRLEVLEQSRGQIASLVEVAELRVTLGEARPSELARLEIEQARLNVEIVRAAEMARARKEILNLLLGSTSSGDLRVEADITILPDLCSVDDAVAQGISRHPRLQAAGLRIRSAAARLGEERAKRLPDFEVGAFYEKELDARSYGGALEISIPLWNWNSAEIARGKAVVEASRYERDLALLELEAAIREAHAEAVGALEKARMFQEFIVPKAREASAAVDKTYQVGEEDVMNVLDARRELIEIESELLEACLGSQLAHARLVTLMGGKGYE